MSHILPVLNSTALLLQSSSIVSIGQWTCSTYFVQRRPNERGMPYISPDLPLSRRLLSTAAWLGRADCVAALLQRGVDPRLAHNSFGETALFVAVTAGQQEAARVILDSPLGETSRTRACDERKGS